MSFCKIVITADGSCFGNPGPGGWAALLKFGDSKKELFGYDPQTTNNKMELQSVLSALSILRRPCDITFRLDSTYVGNGLMNLDEYEKSGWKTKTGSPVKNLTQWKKIKELLKPHQYQVVHVDAHTGDPDNEWCDATAKKQWKENFILLKEN